jgi:hypothetical protein
MRNKIKTSLLAGAALAIVSFAAPQALAIGPFTPEQALIDRLAGQSVAHLPASFAARGAADAEKDDIARIGGKVERPSGRGSPAGAAPSNESERAFVERLGGSGSY